MLAQTAKNIKELAAMAKDSKQFAAVIPVLAQSNQTYRLAKLKDKSEGPS